MGRPFTIVYYSVFLSATEGKETKAILEYLLRSRRQKKHAGTAFSWNSENRLKVCAATTENLEL